MIIMTSVKSAHHISPQLGDCMFALLRKWTDRKQTPTRQHSFRRTLLGVEQMEDRTVPSTVVFSDTYEWSGFFGAATVVVTVTEDAPGYEDQYLWNYQVTNHMFNDLEEFEVPVIDPDEYGFEGIRLVVGNFGSSQANWEGEVGNNPYGDVPFGNQDHRVCWHMVDTGFEIGTGQSADFWFTTVPTSITSGTGVTSAANGGFAPLVWGAVAAPVAPDPSR
jgi:hypothetical protein